MHFPLARLFSARLCCADVQQCTCTAMLYWVPTIQTLDLGTCCSCQFRTSMHPPWMYWTLFRLPHDLKLLASNSRTHSTSCSAVIVLALDPLDITYIASHLRGVPGVGAPPLHITRDDRRRPLLILEVLQPFVKERSNVFPNVQFSL